MKRLSSAIQTVGMFGMGLTDSSSRILINSAAVIRTGLPSIATIMAVLVLMAMSRAL
jgi:hypothetical protein